MENFVEKCLVKQYYKNKDGFYFKPAFVRYDEEGGKWYRFISPQKYMFSDLPDTTPKNYREEICKIALKQLCPREAFELQCKIKMKGLSIDSEEGVQLLKSMSNGIIQLI